MDKPTKLHPAVAALIVIVLLGAGTAGIMALGDNKNESSTTSPSGQSVTDTTQPDYAASTASSTELKDGTYNADGSYRTPGGSESIGVTITLQNGTIQDVALKQQAKSNDAVEYQSKFASGYRSLVVGKNINEVKLSRVAGSSLTSNGFNDALEQIKQDAA
jgi:uncharacterized protein with FMN-binding domain